MKQIIVSTTLTLILSTSLMASELNIQLKNIKNNKGKILAALWNNPTQYMGNFKPTYKTSVNAQKGNMNLIFKDIPSGNYVISILQDTNNNKKMDIGMFGPTESFGFSKDLTGFMAPPAFDDAKIFVSRNTTAIINMK